MFDFNFDWKDELNTNIEDVDFQHKQLFRIGRDIEQLLRINCIGVQDQQLLNIICDLRNFVSYHFYEEEQLMEQANYSNLENHRKQHQQFTNVIMNIDCPAMKKNPKTELYKLKDQMTKYIFTHMMTEDLTMANEIRDKLIAKKG